jgi:hypothetical protein
MQRISIARRAAAIVEADLIAKARRFPKRYPDVDIPF